MFTLLRSIIAVAVAFGCAGCSSGSERSPTNPTAAVVPTAAVMPSEALASSGAVPTVTELSVTIGSTTGGTPMKISGSNLERGARVTFGSATAVTSSSWDPRGVRRS